MGIVENLAAAASNYDIFVISEKGGTVESVCGAKEAKIEWRVRMNRKVVSQTRTPTFNF